MDCKLGLRGFHFSYLSTFQITFWGIHVIPSPLPHCRIPAEQDCAINPFFVCDHLGDEQMQTLIRWLPGLKHCEEAGGQQKLRQKRQLTKSCICTWEWWYVHYEGCQQHRNSGSMCELELFTALIS